MVPAGPPGRAPRLTRPSHPRTEPTPCTPLNRILQAGKLVPALEQALHARYSVHRLADEPDPAAFLAEHGAQFDAVVTSAAIGLPAQHLAALPSVKVISSFGVGLDKVPVESQGPGHCRGLHPDVLNDCVADTAFALLLDVARRTAEADRFVRAGQWARLGGNSFGLGRKVSGARMGVVGLGRIGQTIARRGLGFDMEVRYPRAARWLVCPGRTSPPLTELATWCDFLVVITSGGPSTRHPHQRNRAQRTGAWGFLINVARGTVVDEAALIRALQDGRIAGAGLDVFERAPGAWTP